MMEKEELLDKIKKLKEEKEAIILAHNYQRGEIQDIADYIGDSLELARISTKLYCKFVVFCGVRFMAENTKILSPEKNVLLAEKEAGCPMADMVKVDGLLRLKKLHPDAMVVSYVNTNADVKAESDVCCTSANAVKVVQNVKSKKIIFVPDRNLANYVSRFTDKEIIPWNGYCYVHEKFTPEEVKIAKNEGIVIVHPECKKEVIDLADKVFSTSGMVRFAKECDEKNIIIGTEEGLLYRLKKECIGKNFFTLGAPRMCRNMKLTTIESIYLALKYERYKIEMPEEIMIKAKEALDRMLEFA